MYRQKYLYSISCCLNNWFCASLASKIPTPLYLIFLLPFMLAACQKPDAKEQPSTAMSQPDTAKTKVAFLVYNQVEALDLNGPLDVLTKAKHMSDDAFEIYTVGQSHDPIDTEGGSLKIVPAYSIADAPPADILVIPGAALEVIKDMMDNDEMIGWIKQQANQSERTMSVCTGALILAKTGLLDHQKATTHYFAIQQMKREFPNIQVMEGTRFVIAGKYLTTAGITSGIDGALQLVEAYEGKPVADMIAQVMVYSRQDTLNFLPEETQAMQAGDSPAVAVQSLDDSKDPVCQMTLRGQVSDTVHYHGKVIGFCMNHCKSKFLKNPEQYAANLEKQ